MNTSILSTIIVRASADLYLGAPQFQLMIDDKPVGAVQTVTVSHSQKAWQEFTFTGDFGTTGPSKVEIVYLNDLWGGSSDKDRNLYIDRIIVNDKLFETELVGFYDRVSGSDLAGTERMSRAGTMRFDTVGAAPGSIGASTTSATTTSVPTSPTTDDTIVVRVSGDQYLGGPQFQLFVDGKQVGTTQTVSAVHSKGEWQEFTFDTDFATTGSHKVEVVYTNDKWGGSSSQDRNLYVDKITVNGVVYQAEEDAVFLSRSGALGPGKEKMAIAGKLIFDIETTETNTEPTPAPSGSGGVGPGATGQFVVGSDGTIYDPQGHEFEVRGANLFPNQYGASFITAIGPEAWDFNALRIDWLPGKYTYEQLDKTIDAYTSLGIVTIIDWHQVGGYMDSPEQRNAILAHFEYLAETYKDNPYVWYGGYNEPGGSGDVAKVNNQWQWDPTDVAKWVDLSRDIIQTVRDAGATAPVLAPSMCLAQDILMDSNWNRNVGFSVPVEERSAILKHGDKITSGFENVVFDVHMYGNYNTQDRLQHLDFFLDEVEDRGIAIIFGEYGMGLRAADGTFNSTIQASKNMAALRDEHSFGDIVFHASAANPNDVTIAPGTEGGVREINSFVNPTNLTEAGQIAWDGTHLGT